MGDDFGPTPEVPLIDARSPAERWAEAGRAGVGRMREKIEHSRLDQAGLCWMGLLLVYTALQMYTSMRADGVGADSWWIRATFLASSGGLVLILGSITALAVAALANTSAARLTLRLALVGGTWLVLAGLLGVAVSVHFGASITFSLTRSGDGKVASALGNLCYSGLGAIVAVLAWHLLNPSAERSFDSIRSVTP